MTVDPTLSALSPTPDRSGPHSGHPPHVRQWLAEFHPRQLALLDQFLLDLRFAAARPPTSAPPLSGRPDRLSRTNTNDGSDGRSRNRRLISLVCIELLKNLLGPTKWTTPAHLMYILSAVGTEVHRAAGPREPALGNVVRRVMAVVREEVGRMEAQRRDEAELTSPQMLDEPMTMKPPTVMRRISSSSSVAPGGGDNRPSLSDILWAHPQHLRKGGTGEKRSHLARLRSGSIASASSERSRGEQRRPPAVPLPPAPQARPLLPPSFHEQANATNLIQCVMEAIQEVKDELVDLYSAINKQVESFVHPDEVILTYGKSKTVELFLKAAHSKSRRFSVIILEGAPQYGGHALAASLAADGISTTVVHDSALFAVMARANKVLLPAHAVLANGGLVAPSGSRLAALAARELSVPVVVVTGLFKLCPLWPHEGQDTLNELLSPDSLIGYKEANGGDGALSDVEILNPVHDYITPDLIKLYVTNVGGFQPSFVYRLLGEYYHNDDWEEFE